MAIDTSQLPTSETIEEAFFKGEGVRNPFTLQDLVTLAYIDPGTLTAYVMNPAGVISDYIYGTDPEVVRESAGKYYIDVLGDTEGFWAVRWLATQPNKARERRFVIVPTLF